PCRKTFQFNKTDHCGTYKKFVCKRIHKFSKIGNKMVFPCQVSVKPVCNTGNDKNRKGNIAVCLPAPSCKKEKNKERYHDHSSYGKFIRCIHQPILLSNRIQGRLSRALLQNLPSSGVLLSVRTDNRPRWARPHMFFQYKRFLRKPFLRSSP